MTDGGVRPAVEHLAVDALDVPAARAVLDLQPAAQPLHVRSPGVGESLVEPLATPVLVALPKARRREEEDGLRAGELGAAAQILAVGEADRGRVPELAAVMAVHRAAHLGVSGHVDVDGRLALE